MKKRAFRALLLMLVCIFIVIVYGCAPRQNNVPGEQDAAKTATPTDPEPVECNWTLEVSDTQTANVNGYDFTCTLTIMAVKLGGKDAMGKYSGLATLQYEYDMQEGNISGNSKGSGQDNYAEFEVVAYVVEDSLAPLVTYDATANGSFIFTGSGDVVEKAGDASWSTSESKSIEAPYIMEVDGGQVSIELPSIAPGVKFKGMITGTPI